MDKQFKIFQRNFLIICAIFLAVSSKHVIFAAPVATICFYNPEININNFASLKRDFDTYLSDFGDYRFQPFSSMKTFEKFISLKQAEVMVVSSWHYRIIKNSIALIPALVGVKKGKFTYRKILVANNDVKDIASLNGATLASSGNKQYTYSALEEMLGDEFASIKDTLNVLAVPKDIDALMGLGFGVSQAALVSEISFENLAGLNPNLYKTLKKVSVSKELFFPIVAVVQGMEKENEKLMKIIETMGDSEQGSDDLKILGLTGWKRLTEKEKGLLNDVGH